MDHVTIERRGKIAVVSFDRGRASNPLSLDLMQELTDAARSFEGDAQTAAVVLTGRADNFSMGFDLGDPKTTRLQDAGLAELRQAAQIGKRMCAAWAALEPLTICAINGWCVGGGFALAVATDLRVAGRGCGFYVPEVERGLNMSWGSIPRIVNLVGLARAKRLIVLSEKLNTQTAEAWGLLDRACDDGTALEASLELAQSASQIPINALRMSKKGIDAYANALAGVATHADHDQFALAFGSADAREGIAAFFEKRDPEFTGR